MSIRTHDKKTKPIIIPISPADHMKNTNPPDGAAARANCPAGIVWRLLIVLTFVAAADNGHAADPSKQLDDLIGLAGRRQKLTPSPICSDERFLRRIMLDLTGRIPTPAERERFLNTPNREKLVDDLLAGDEFVQYWSDLWTTQWYGYNDGEGSEREGLAHWLADQIRARRPYDQIVQTLITATGESATSGPVNFMLRYPTEPVVKVSRAFLGIRLDCARCHDHPFDRWSQDDFQRMNRFFDGIERREVASGNARLVNVIREVAPEERPRFLSGATPRTNQWRSEFARFMVNSRPFARNFANRLWYHLIGRGIVHPVDDFSRENKPVLPDVLEKLTDDVERSGFDLRATLRQISLTQAYQRTSQASHGDQERQNLFLTRSIKPLAPEQWYASWNLAFKRTPNAEERRAFVEKFHGASLDGEFSASWDYRETPLSLMSRLVEQSPPPASSINDLFITLLCRPPTEEERVQLRRCTPQEITFALLHSSEFAFNH
jgi:hypothetical protein